MGAKVVLFIESTKLFDGKLFFDIDFVAFEIKRPADLSIVKRLGGFSWVHLFRFERDILANGAQVIGRDAEKRGEVLQGKVMHDAGTTT